jgi:hypothetical protein
MRKSLLRPFDLRLQVIKGLPWACALLVTLAAATAAAGEHGSFLHFTSMLVACVAARWFASNEARWNRYMAWLPDELKGEK